MEEALKLLLQHKDTGDYVALYSGLKILIRENKEKPEAIDPLLRAVSFTILEPLMLQIEKHLNEETPVKEENPGEVIFVDFAKRKRLRSAA